MMLSSYHHKTTEKIVENSAILKDILNKKHCSKKIVLVKGVYDLLHCGHYYSFINARDYGEVLVVAVNSDQAVRNRKGIGRPIIDQYNRMLMIAALSCVDWVTLYDEKGPYELLKTIEPHVFVASHFKSLSIEERKSLEETISFQVVPKMGNISTTKIINNIKMSQ